ncbi:hypothetical protein [Anaeroselena agilis]|uniref:Uncharacterized protein n=1 Tax=Anaeroselena agilis TaxID=3063788 RepID=A0ABU3NY97_9FIRM|nr:hypothetical protein [Selenomonadales bacterium 4137-cl]
MEGSNTGWSIRLARTLWFNTYRALVEDAAGEYVATLRLIPAIPLDRGSVPEDAPVVDPYVLVVVEDAVFAEEELVNFEGQVAGLLLEKMAQPDFNPAFCQFAYPSAPRGAGPQVMELGS